MCFFKWDVVGLALQLEPSCTCHTTLVTCQTVERVALSTWLGCLWLFRSDMSRSFSGLSVVNGDATGETLCSPYIYEEMTLLISHMFSDEINHRPEVFLSIYYRGS